MDEDKRQRIFSNIESIYQFHNDYLLPQLLERWKKYEGTQLISDVIKSKAPFLKMYSEYTNNYRNAIKTFNKCVKKNRKFASVVREAEVCKFSSNMLILADMLLLTCFF